MELTDSVRLMFVSVMLVSVLNVDTLDNVMDLYDTLFTKSNYNRNIRGVMDQTETVRVGATFSLITLGQVMEKEESFQVMGFLQLTWKDERLVWNTSDYNGTEEILVYQETVWKPEVKLSNPMTRVNPLGHERTQIRIDNTGKLIWVTPDMFQATCAIDVVSFPWDRQTCKLEFTIATYNTDEVVVESDSDEIFTKSFSKHESWELIKAYVIQVSRGYSRVQFGFCVERRPSFHISVVFVPIVFLSILNVFVCFVKIDSGERISLAITLLLSIILNLSMVAENLPNHSKGMAALIYLLNFVLAESTGICLISILSLHVYNKRGIPPQMCQNIVKRCLGPRCNTIDTADDNDVVKTVPNYEIADNKIENVDASLSNLGKTRYNLGVTWMDVSLFIDRAFFYVSTTAIIIAFITFSIVVVYNRIDCP